jgi:two-component system chemotaxis sensor kinase CheA
MSIFQVESEEILERIFENLLALESAPSDPEISRALYRDLHSIKGAIRMVGFNNIQTIIHKIEDIFDKINQYGFVLDSNKIITITKSIELVSKYLQESVENNREIIGDEFSSTI